MRKMRMFLLKVEENVIISIITVFFKQLFSVEVKSVIMAPV